MRLFCILRDCYFEPTSTSVRRPNPKDVAALLQLDSRTVKSRVKNWERRGFIRYYQLIPNYSLFGIESTSFLLKVSNIVDKAKALAKVSLVDGVTSILEFLGDTFLVWVIYDDEDQLVRRLNLLMEMTGCQNPTRFLDEPFEPVEMKLSKLDWEILKSMRNDAMKSITALARELKVTRKTVRAHVERMQEKNAFFVRAIFDVTRVKGLIFYGLAISIDPARREEVLGELDGLVTCSDNCFIRMVTRSGSVFFALWAEDLAHLEETVVRANQIPGVTNVDLRLYKRLIEYPDPIERLMDKKIQESSIGKVLLLEATSKTRSGR